MTRAQPHERLWSRLFVVSTVAGKRETRIWVSTEARAYLVNGRSLIGLSGGMDPTHRPTAWRLRLLRWR